MEEEQREKEEEETIMIIKPNSEEDRYDPSAAAAVHHRRRDCTGETATNPPPTDHQARARRRRTHRVAMSVASKASCMFSFDAKINLETCMEKVILMSKYGTETLRITGHIRPPRRCRRSRRRRRVTTYIRTCGGAAPAVLLVLEPFQKYQKKLVVWFRAMFDSGQRERD